MSDKFKMTVPKYKVGDLLYIGLGQYMFITGSYRVGITGFYEMYELRKPEYMLSKEWEMMEIIVENRCG